MTEKLMEGLTIIYIRIFREPVILVFERKGKRPVQLPSNMIKNIIVNLVFRFSGKYNKKVFHI